MSWLESLTELRKATEYYHPSHLFMKRLSRESSRLARHASLNQYFEEAWLNADLRIMTANCVKGIAYENELSLAEAHSEAVELMEAMACEHEDEDIKHRQPPGLLRWILPYCPNCGRFRYPSGEWRWA